MNVVVNKKVINNSSFIKGKFLATSPVFMRKYGKSISTASHLINSNYKRLLAGEVISEKGFVIRKGFTGKSHKGSNTHLALSVSFKGKVFFVKVGVDCGERVFLAYQRAKEIFKGMGNKFNGYKLEVVPYHFLYQNASKKKVRGFLVSDFFPSSKVSLVLDIERALGKENFLKTRLGSTLDSLETKLKKKGLIDIGSHNCFFDEAKNAIYFFDLQLLLSSN